MSQPTRPSFRHLYLAAALASVFTLAGCGAIVVGGAAATTAVVATDRRTAGEQVEDKSIELKAANQLRAAFPDNNKVRVNPTSYAAEVLLTGDVPSEADSSRAESIVAGVENVRRVINQLRVGEPTPLGVRTNDTWITSKVRATLINTKDVPSLAITVTTERGVVYLLGKVTEDEGQRAARAAAHIPGVNKVVKLFQIVPPESIARPGSNEAAPETSPAPDAPAADAGSSNDVQTMPVK